MRVRLLNDGRYGELSRLTFPVEVDGKYNPHCKKLVDVEADEIIRIGAEGWKLEDGILPFFVGSECEVLTDA